MLIEHPITEQRTKSKEVSVSFRIGEYSVRVKRSENTRGTLIDLTSREPDMEICFRMKTHACCSMRLEMENFPDFFDGPPLSGKLSFKFVPVIKR